MQRLCRWRQRQRHRRIRQSDCNSSPYSLNSRAKNLKLPITCKPIEDRTSVIRIPRCVDVFLKSLTFHLYALCKNTFMNWSFMNRIPRCFEVFSSHLQYKSYTILHLCIEYPVLLVKIPESLDLTRRHDACFHTSRCDVAARCVCNVCMLTHSVLRLFYW